jgi:hypothetical protein
MDHSIPHMSTACTCLSITVPRTETCDLIFSRLLDNFASLSCWPLAVAASRAFWRPIMASTVCVCVCACVCVYDFSNALDTILFIQLCFYCGWCPWSLPKFTCTYLCVCVCVCVRERERGFLVPSAPSCLLTSTYFVVDDPEALQKLYFYLEIYRYTHAQKRFLVPLAPSCLFSSTELVLDDPCTFMHTWAMDPTGPSCRACEIDLASTVCMYICTCICCVYMYVYACVCVCVAGPSCRAC